MLSYTNSLYNPMSAVEKKVNTKKVASEEIKTTKTTKATKNIANPAAVASKSTAKSSAKVVAKVEEKVETETSPKISITVLPKKEAKVPAKVQTKKVTSKSKALVENASKPSEGELAGNSANVAPVVAPVVASKKQAKAVGEKAKPKTKKIKKDVEKADEEKVNIKKKRTDKVLLKDKKTGEMKLQYPNRYFKISYISGLANANEVENNEDKQNENEELVKQLEQEENCNNIAAADKIQKTLGRFKGKKPKQAANKAFTSLNRKRIAYNKKHDDEQLDLFSPIFFSIKECTRGWDNKIFHYKGKKVHLDEKDIIEVPKKQIKTRTNQNGEVEEFEEIEKVVYKYKNIIQKYSPKDGANIDGDEEHAVVVEEAIVV